MDMNGKRRWAVEPKVVTVQNVSERGVERSDKSLLGSIQQAWMLLLPLLQIVEETRKFFRNFLA